MGRSLLDQLTQINGSLTYDGAVSSAETGGVAEAQTSLEGDLNVLRTLLQQLKDPAKSWYELPDLTVDAVARKWFQCGEQPAGFINVASGTGTNSSAFDIPLKSITGHNDGGGNSTTEGVITNATFAHKLMIRDHATQNAINDGSGNEVYGRLVHDNTIIESLDDNNQLSGYENITGVTADNTDASRKLHLQIIDEGGGNYHVDIYSDAGHTQLVAHTASYNTIGAKALIEDNTSGIGGTITVDAIVAADLDIEAQFGTYRLEWYSWASGVETAYNFTASQDIDLIEVLVSRQYQDLPWTKPYAPSFHDTSGFTGVVDDDNVTAGPFSDLLAGLTTQAQVNAKVDDLGSTANAEGASLVAIEDASAWYTGAQVEAALNEIEALFGSTTSTTYDFSENNVLLDNDAVYPALNKLDLKWGDLASTANAEGASLVGVEDSAGYFTGANVEAVLAELYLLAETATVEKEVAVNVGPITSGTPVTIPNANTYTLGSGVNMDVYVNGQLMVFGGTEDYTETSTTQVTFNFTIPAGSNITYIIRQ